MLTLVTEIIIIKIIILYSISTQNFFCKFTVIIVSKRQREVQNFLFSLIFYFEINYQLWSNLIYTILIDDIKSLETTNLFVSSLGPNYLVQNKILGKTKFLFVLIM